MANLMNCDFDSSTLEKAGNIASAAASFLIEKEGPMGYKTREEIQKRVESKEYIPSKINRIIKNNFY